MEGTITTEALRKKNRHECTNKSAVRGLRKGHCPECTNKNRMSVRQIALYYETRSTEQTKFARNYSCIRGDFFFPEGLNVSP